MRVTDSRNDERPKLGPGYHSGVKISMCNFLEGPTSIVLNADSEVFF